MHNDLLKRISDPLPKSVSMALLANIFSSIVSTVINDNSSVLSADELAKQMFPSKIYHFNNFKILPQKTRIRISNAQRKLITKKLNSP